MDISGRMLFVGGHRNLVLATYRLFSRNATSNQLPHCLNVHRVHHEELAKYNDGAIIFPK